MINNKKNRMELRISDKLKKEVELFCDKHDISMSELIRRLLEREVYNRKTLFPINSHELEKLGDN